ncbi:unnamed protein product [Ectocarpus fasciculatus]
MIVPRSFACTGIHSLVGRGVVRGPTLKSPANGGLDRTCRAGRSDVTWTCQRPHVSRMLKSSTGQGGGPRTGPGHGRDDDLAYSKVGTPLYISVEVLGGGGYSWKRDFWSLGCVLYELAMLRSPFKSENLNRYHLHEKISRAHSIALGMKRHMDAMGNAATPPRDRSPSEVEEPDAQNGCSCKYENSSNSYSYSNNRTTTVIRTITTTTITMTGWIPTAAAATSRRGRTERVV